MSCIVTHTNIKNIEFTTEGDLNMFKKYVFGGKVVIESKVGWYLHPLVIPKSYSAKQEKLYEEFWGV